MSFKKFIFYFLSTLILFIAINALIWNLSTKHILVKNNTITSGDLARIGYLSSFTFPREDTLNLKKQHFEVNNYNFENLDLLTLGDSFSNGSAGGLNRYYQDYISTYLNWNILNINKYRQVNEIETIITLLNSGILKKMKVKYVLYESTQRKIVDRLTTNINYSSNDTEKNIINYYKFGVKRKNVISLPNISFINNGNFKFLLFKFLYNFSDNAYISKVYIGTLDRKLFTTRPYKQFLFYKHELKSISKNTKQNLEIANNTLNKLAKKLKEQNIKLIFMPAVSKYDLYSKLMINNKYPKDPFFDIFRKLKKDYIFIDTKDILLKELEKDEKDIFYIDDTHWSYKASDTIAKHLKSLLQPEQ
jgi:hypothetical protein